MQKWRKRILRVFLLALLIPLLLFVFLVFERVRGKISLAGYKRALIAKGEKLSAIDFVSPPSTNGENGARGLFAAISELKEGKVLPNRLPPRMQVMSSGHALVGFREDEWVEDKMTNDWSQVLEDLKTNQLVFERARAELQKPVFDNELDLSQGARMSLPHLVRAKKLTQWLGAGTQLELHDGRAHETLQYLLPEIQMPRVLSQDGILISELVRYALATIATQETWEALQADGWSDNDLATVEAALQNQLFFLGMVRALQGEIIYSQVTYEGMRNSNQETAQVLYGFEESLNGFMGSEPEAPFWQRVLSTLPGGESISSFLKKKVYCWIWRFAWLDQDERQYLAKLKALLDCSRAAAAGEPYTAIAPRLVSLRAGSTKRNAYDRLRFPVVSSIFAIADSVSRPFRVETDRSLAICAVALKRFHLRHGAYPPSLEALVPEFLSSLPIDYMDGKSLKYRLNEDKSFTLYSVGEDGKDDGGNLGLMPERTNLKNLWYRNDYIWPAPALPEEIEAYRKEAIKH
jgi:hypothetical protein